MSERGRIDILLVEDNPGDVLLITEALAETEARPSIIHAKDGVEALQFLRHSGQFEGAPEPSIVILDLNLPRKNGQAVLAEIRSDPVLALLPVIILSGSDAPQDIARCYALHANCYIVKPRDLAGMNETIHSLADFWLSKVKLPPGLTTDAGLGGRG